MLSSLLSLRFLFILSLSLSIADGQSLTVCPTTKSLVTDANGAQFQICPGTDIQAPSINIINGVTSVQACLALCQTTTGCKKAVFSAQYSICHIKGNPDNVPWVANTNYDAILFTQQLNAGTRITSCATQSQVITNQDGTQITICPMSDYTAPSVNIINGVSDVTACAQICATTSGCQRIVYDRLYSICHIKGSDADLPWVINLKQYDSAVIVRLVSSTSSSAKTSKTTTSVKVASTTSSSKTTTALLSTKSSSSTTSSKTTTSTTQTETVAGLTACPASPTPFVADDGSVYEMCPGTDYQGTSTEVQENVLSLWECLQSCNIKAGCERAVYLKSGFRCFLKGSSLTWVTSTSFSSVRLVSKTTYQAPPYKGLGVWSVPIMMPVIPVAAYVVPQQPVSNRVLMFSSWGRDDFSGPTGITQFADYNYLSGVVSQRTITNTNHDMFCPGISSLPDGRIIITGGENAEVTSFYDPATDAFIRGPDMKIPRGYHSSATTSSGKVFTIGGSFSGGIGGKTGELFDPSTNAWSVISGADVTPMLTNDAAGAWRTDNHAWLYGWKDGSVFQAGPSKVQHWYKTDGTGAVVTAGTRDADNDAMCGVNVMYDAVAGKIFSTGGAQSYTDSDAFAKTHITTIGEPYTASTVERVSDMNHPRAFANGVVLPDGKVLVTGGQKRALVFTDTDSSLAPELYDPVTKTFTELASARISRNYHSVALLLADGTVFTGGGGMCPTAFNQDTSWCNRASDHPSAEIFSPPYLFNADGSAAERPVISSLSSPASSTGLTATVGSVLTVTMNKSADLKFALIRMGSATHSVNTDQRRVPLTKVAATQNRFTITLPSDSGILVPGYYYLFAISSAGVPSVARTVQVQL